MRLKIMIPLHPITSPLYRIMSNAFSIRPRSMLKMQKGVFVIRPKSPLKSCVLPPVSCLFSWVLCLLRNKLYLRILGLSNCPRDIIVSSKESLICRRPPPVPSRVPLQGSRRLPFNISLWVSKLDLTYFNCLTIPR